MMQYNILLQYKKITINITLIILKIIHCSYKRRENKYFVYFCSCFRFLKFFFQQLPADVGFLQLVTSFIQRLSEGGQLLYQLFLFLLSTSHSCLISLQVFKQTGNTNLIYETNQQSITQQTSKLSIRDQHKLSFSCRVNRQNKRNVNYKMIS